MTTGDFSDQTGVRRRTGAKLEKSREPRVESSCHVPAGDVFHVSSGGFRFGWGADAGGGLKWVFAQGGAPV